MERTRSRLVLGCAALLFLSISKPILAISPSIIMVYGGSLEKPLLLQPSSPADFPSLQLLWWKAGPYDRPHTLRGNPAVTGLASRSYVNLAIFWGQYDSTQLKPENASQHGRLYLPTASEPTTVIVTMPDMEPTSNPIPKEPEAFAAMWTLNPQQTAILKSWGVPGL